VLWCCCVVVVLWCCGVVVVLLCCGVRRPRHFGTSRLLPPSSLTQQETGNTNS
jgi:hypothetical protein